MPADEPSETPSWSATERTEMHDFSSGKSFHSGFPLKFLKNSVQNGSDPFGDRKGLKPKKPDAIECFFASIPSGDTLLSRNERIQKTLKIQCLMRTCRFESGFGAIEFSAETGEKRTAACFCDPYVSNQKAGAENMDGQLRRHFPKEGDVDEYADEYVAQSFGNINSAPLKSLGDEIARAIEEFVKGQAKPQLGNGLHPRKRTSAPFFGAHGNGALSASSPHSLSGHTLLLPR